MDEGEAEKETKGCQARREEVGNVMPEEGMQMEWGEDGEGVGQWEK